MATTRQAMTPASHSDNLRGSMMMVAGMAGFAINDTFVKAVGETLNLGQTLLIRGIFATIAIFLLARMMGQIRPARGLASPGMLIRAAGEMVATFAFITALFHMPIANVSAIFQALPLALTLYAALFMREEVGWRRMIAMLVGFSGVIIIIRPGFEGFTVYSLFVLLAVAGSMVRDIATRTMPRDVPGLMIALVTSMGVTLMGGAISLIEPWNPVGMKELALLASTSIFLIIGYYGVVAAMRIGDIGFVSPFRYSILLFSILGGMIVFGEFPDKVTLAGAAIVVASGIYTLYRERLVHRQKITPPPQRH